MKRLLFDFESSGGHLAVRMTNTRHHDDHWPKVLKAIRRAATPKVSQAQLSAQLGMVESYISRLEMGHALPTQDALNWYGRMVEEQRRWKG